MSNPNVTLALLPGTEDPPITDSSYQSELQQFAHALEAAEVSLHARQYMPRMKPGMLYMSLPGFLGEFVLPFAQIASPVVVGALTAWIAARGNRRVRIKVGATEIEARSLEEIRQLLEEVKAFQDRTSGENEESK